jgi:hypothetical protein
VLAPPVSELRAKKAEEKATEEQAKKKACENGKAAEQEEGENRQYVLNLLDEYQNGELAHMEDEKGEEETKVKRDSSHYWGSVDKSSKFWTKLLENKETWLLVDLHRGETYENGRRPCKIVLTSTLRKGDWPDLDSGGSTLSKKLYMAPLSLEEATNINSAAESKNASQSLVDLLDFCLVQGRSRK